MIYSVWSQPQGVFEYYEANAEQAKLNAEKPAHLVAKPLGMTVDQAAWPLPAGARKIGQGVEVIGRVASTSKGALGGALDLAALTASPIMVGVLGVTAYLAWQHFKKKRAR